jgi:hypothetical protein
MEKSPRTGDFSYPKLPKIMGPDQTLIFLFLFLLEKGKKE